MTNTAEVLVHGRFQPTPTPTLEDELGPLPVVGVRRLIVSVLRLATELDLGQQSRRAPEIGGRGALPSLGRRIARILAAKPLYLEGSMWTPPGQADARVLRRSADADVVTALSCLELHRSALRRRHTALRGGERARHRSVAAGGGREPLRGAPPCRVSRRIGALSQAGFAHPLRRVAERHRASDANGRALTAHAPAVLACVVSCPTTDPANGRFFTSQGHDR